MNRIDRVRHARPALATLAIAAAFLLTAAPSAQQAGEARGEGDQEGFRFRSSVELINVTATVTDSAGRFVSGLDRDDFIVYEDGVPQEISHFSNERVPVSLGIALDTSGSMVGQKIAAARSALRRFLFDLLGPEDEIFLYQFSDRADLVQDWTTDREVLNRALRRIMPRGGTAMYDAVAEAAPLAETGRNRKKALLLISDGNDTNSEISPREVKQLVRETEVLLYAIGIDGRGQPTITRGYPPRNPLPPPRIPLPFPVPGRRSPPRWPGGPQQGGVVWSTDDRVNAGALRDLTDDSGGRTEIIREPDDLVPATESIADELSKQYFLAYAAKGERDGRWHTIRVEVRDRSYRVRARRGYIAS